MHKTIATSHSRKQDTNKTKSKKKVACTIKIEGTGDRVIFRKIHKHRRSSHFFEMVLVGEIGSASINSYCIQPTLNLDRCDQHWPMVVVYGGLLKLHQPAWLAHVEDQVAMLDMLNSSQVLDLLSDHHQQKQLLSSLVGWGGATKHIT